MAGDRSAGAQGGEVSHQGERFVASVALLGASAPQKELLEAKWEEVATAATRVPASRLHSRLRKEASKAAN